MFTYIEEQIQLCLLKKQTKKTGMFQNWQSAEWIFPEKILKYHESLSESYSSVLSGILIIFRKGCELHLEKKFCLPAGLVTFFFSVSSLISSHVLSFVHF